MYYKKEDEMQGTGKNQPTTTLSPQAKPRSGSVMTSAASTLFSPQSSNTLDGSPPTRPNSATKRPEQDNPTAATMMSAIPVTKPLVAKDYKLQDFETSRAAATAKLEPVKKFADLRDVFHIRGYYNTQEPGEPLIPQAPLHLINLINILHFIIALGRNDSDLFFLTNTGFQRPTRAAIITYMQKECFDINVEDKHTKDSANELFDLCLHTGDKQVTTKLFSANSYYTGSMEKIIGVLTTEVNRLREFPEITNDKIGTQTPTKTFNFLTKKIFPLTEVITYFDHTQAIDDKDPALTSLLRNVVSMETAPQQSTNVARRQRGGSCDTTGASPKTPETKAQREAREFEEFYARKMAELNPTRK